METSRSNRCANMQTTWNHEHDKSLSTDKGSLDSCKAEQTEALIYELMSVKVND